MQLFISDLDGTLLGRDGRLSPATRRGLTALLEAGLPFTVATARGIPGIQSLLSDLPIQLPVIGGNGAFLSDFKTGEHFHVCSLEVELAASLYEFLVQKKLSPFVSSISAQGDQIYFKAPTNPAAQAYVDEKRRHRDPRVRWGADPEESLQHAVTSMTLFGTFDELAPLETELRLRFDKRLAWHFYKDVYQPDYFLFTMLHPKATKSGAIELLLKQLELGPESCTVFGDSHNDISMFRMAGRAVATSNAVDELRELAHEIIGSNETDSVLKYLRGMVVG